MKNFDYKLNYKKLNFRNPKIRKLYRIGRGEQGVLLVRPYTNVICRKWRFATQKRAQKSAVDIHNMYMGFRAIKDFIGMDMCRKFLEMGFTRARRYANHRDGKKYDSKGNVKPQEKDALTCEKAKSARIFKRYRDLVTHDPIYIDMRKNWRELENAHEDNNTQRT
jgi:hypothetical protein